MTLKEAREFLDNMAAQEATQMGLSEGFAADLHWYHCRALHMAIRSLEAWEKVKADIGDMSILSSYQLKSGESTITLYEGLCKHSEVMQIINEYLLEVEGKG